MLNRSVLKLLRQAGEIQVTRRHRIRRSLPSRDEGSRRGYKDAALEGRRLADGLATSTGEDFGRGAIEVDGD
jgi:hypothetical protein